MASKYSDEKILLAGLKAEKSRAFTYLYTEYKYWMLLEAYGYLNDELASQDLVQELLIDFWEHKLYENVLVNLKGYLIIMIRNRCMNYLRKLSRQKNRLSGYVTVEELVLPDVDLQRGELARRIDEAIEKLPPRTRNAFLYCYVEQMGHQEAANLLGVSRNTIRSQLKTAVKFLRKELKKFLYS